MMTFSEETLLKQARIRLDNDERPKGTANRDFGPFDCGSKDSFHEKRFNPHYFDGNTLVLSEDMTQEELIEYAHGFVENEIFGWKKSFFRERLW